MPAVGWEVDGEVWSFTAAYQFAKEHGLWKSLPPTMLRAMQSDRIDGHWVSPSDAGGCPRSRILKQREDYLLEPYDRIVPTTGTAVHRLLAGHNEDGTDTETHLGVDLVVPLRDGTLVSYRLQGTDDYFDRSSGLLMDYKTTRTGSAWKRLPYDRHLLQLNLYAFIRQANGFEVKRLLIWYLKQGGKEPKYEGFEVELWNMHDIEMMACEIAEPLAWYQKTGELPQNIYDPDDYNCKYCPVVQHCLNYRKEGR